MAAPKNKVYDPKIHPELAKRVVSEFGETGKKLAAVLGVTADTMRHWKARYPEFAQAFQEGVDSFRVEVAEVSLFKRVTGFKHKETHYKYIEAPEKPAGTMKRVKSKVVTKEVAPDVDACKFWLTNQAPDRWGKQGDGTPDDASIAKFIEEIRNLGAGGSAGRAAPPEAGDPDAPVVPTH